MKIQKFQEGGQVQGGAPAGQGGAQGGTGDPMEQIIPAMQQAYQAQDCGALMQAVGAFLQVLSQAQGGAPAQAEQPAFARNGGRITRVR